MCSNSLSLGGRGRGRGLVTCQRDTSGSKGGDEKTGHTRLFFGCNSMAVVVGCRVFGGSSARGGGRANNEG